MLQIRLSKQPAETGGSLKPSPAETVTVACPAHLVLADLPVAKGIGAATAATSSKTVGRRSRRVLGERVHFCVRCDFPIAIYGRLSPCDHAFCLDCARSDSICYICDEGIQKIQTIKMMEGIFICAAPHCLKSFLKREDFTSHIHESHSHLLQPNGAREDGNESDMQGAKPPALDVAVRAPPRALISPGSNSQNFDGDEKLRRPLPLQRPMMPSKQPLFGQLPHFQTDGQLDGSRPSSFDRPVLPNHFQMQQESGQFPDKMPEVPNPEYLPMHAGQPPNFVMPMNPNPMMAPQFGIPPFNPEAGQGFYGSQYEMAQMATPDSTPEGAEQGALPGFPPGPVAGMNFMGNYPHHWNTGAAQGGGQVMGDGFGNTPDSHGNMPYYQGDYGRNTGVPPLAALPPGPPLSGNNGMEGGPGSNSMDPTRDGRGTLASQPFQHPPPPPQSSHASSSQRSRHFHCGDRGHDGQGYGWQHESRDGFGSGQD